MWDTVRHANDVCDVLLPANVKQQSSIKTHASSSSLANKVKFQISKFIINTQKVDINNASKADLLYMWGAFPRNTNQKFIIELDNPYVLSYYNIENFRRNKKKIEENLKKAFKITYLSEAAKNHTLKIFGKDFENKSFVSYPYMEANYQKNNRNNNIVNFIFVGLNSRSKGGDELLEAFSNIEDTNIRLTFISNLSNKKIEKYTKDSRITILPPQPREILLKEIYPKMDVMVFPSFYESFGVVLLEALSFGMGLISINTYATPEIINNGYNGVLMHHPIITPSLYNNKDIICCVNLRFEDFYDRYMNNNEFYYGLYSEIKDALKIGIREYKSWQKNSIELFENKFSPQIWSKNFKNILE
ncbi:glycosyltransferase family 4 protein [Campylobacter curvus]|uniref:glycosyltransferase family 4 protein n=1 Tax=Campylobacter curvus TaxID=200 RepID=UPI00147056D0|nr:glycosyltransferase family 4 protein [Campylobacter curvus]